MRTGVFFLLLAYVLSQFYRAFLAVLAPVLEGSIGVTPADLARSSGLWFLAFAVMQVPVGWALDRIGPRRLAAGLLGVAGGSGALIFALAQGPGAIDLAMVLIGIGCSPVLMASYYIFARVYPAAVFGTLAGAMIGTGTLGNLAASLPLAFAVEVFGWRGALMVLAAVTVVVALALWRFVADPPPAPASEARGSLLDLLRLPALWLILPMAMVNYAPSAGIRGLWAGPYLADVFGLDTGAIGGVTLLMGVAMVVGNFAYGPLDRLFKSRKWVVLGGNLAGAACLFALWALPGGGVWQAAALLALVGLFGASFPLIMAHGRSFVPAHLVGRGVTLLNLFTIGGVAVFQMITARIHGAVSAVSGDPMAPYGALFLFSALVVLAGSAIYLFSEDRTD
ncbi:putative MFS family arabinose efflux permease [Rhodobacteraceae bacterium MBR-64]|jgi:predicted MFS family arabinose efflux permease